MRDVLGCIPKVRYCVEEDTPSDSFSKRVRANEMLEYESSRRRKDASSKYGMRTMATVGACEPNSHNKVVLVRNVNRYSDSEFIHEADPINNILVPLFDKWKPDIFIHLSEVCGFLALCH